MGRAEKAQGRVSVWYWLLSSFWGQALSCQQQEQPAKLEGERRHTTGPPHTPGMQLPLFTSPEVRLTPHQPRMPLDVQTGTAATVWQMLSGSHTQDSLPPSYTLRLSHELVILLGFYPRLKLVFYSQVRKLGLREMKSLS